MKSSSAGHWLQTLLTSKATMAAMALLLIASPEALGQEETEPTAVEIQPTAQNTQGTAPQVQIITPTADATVTSRSTTIILRYTLGSEVELRVNDRVVDNLLIGRTEEDETEGITIQNWYGVVLNPGENTITATASLNGVVSLKSSVTVTVPDQPTQLTLETVESGIPADGRSHATIRGKLLDENGNVSDWNTTVTLQLPENTGKFLGSDLKPEQPGFQVEAVGGEFSAILQSGLEAKNVTIKASEGTLNLQAFTQMQFTTALRGHTLLSGFTDFRLGGRGTDFSSSFRDFLPLDEDNDTRFDVTSAVFATGSIGEWKFTGAYNSDRPLNQDSDGNTRLGGVRQNSELTYPTRGDSSSVTNIAPSTDQVFFRLERTSPVEGADPDFVTWGDYSTEEFATGSQQFSSTSRSLHGSKANYNFGNLQVTGFYGTNVEGFQRDTIVPDGTSGFYFLSRRLLVRGSEEVYIEVEELNRPGTVLERTRLDRNIDYEIDYDRGTVLFTEPQLRTSTNEIGEVLVRRILVTYQFDDDNGGDTDIFGGRVRYHFGRGANRETSLGFSYVREDLGDQDFELIGRGYSNSTRKQ